MSRSAAPTPLSETRKLFESGVISELDFYFAQALSRRAKSEDPRVYLAAALASRAVQAGHVCLDLAALSGAKLVDRDERPLELPLPSLAAWQQLFEVSPIVSQGLDAKQDPLPLVFEAPGRLYLQRYAEYQRRLVSALVPRLTAPFEVAEPLLSEGLAKLFPQKDRAGTDFQRLAACLAVRSRFTIVSGGPGTGKTTTVTKILLLLQEQALASNSREARILLLAPTGKAAQRLTESVEQSLERLRKSETITEEAAASVRREAQTIHRALGYQRRTPTQFRHTQQRPLAAEIVLVDEASMVDLALMTKLVEAVSPSARLILLGDKDQLSSVEAGAILGDMFNPGAMDGYSEELTAFLERTSAQRVPAAEKTTKPIADCRAQLIRSYRYDDTSGIGRFAQAVRDGGSRSALQLLKSEPDGVRLFDTERLSFAQRIEAYERMFRAGYAEYAAAKDVETRLELLGRFRCLSPHRRGPIGVQALNELATEALRPMLGAASHAESFAGRAIIITENDYQMDLYNGDTGVIGSGGETNQLFAFFAQKGTIRRLQLSRLPAYETVFAMTVHKSQGSEFDAVSLVLPLDSSPVFTRELIYTGITRARRSVELIGTEPILAQGLETRVQRASGLRAALWT